MNWLLEMLKSFVVEVVLLLIMVKHFQKEARKKLTGKNVFVVKKRLLENLESIVRPVYLSRNIIMANQQNFKLLEK